jgi:hypothetical protein
MFSGRRLVRFSDPAARALAYDLSFPDLEMMAERGVRVNIPRFTAGQFRSCRCCRSGHQVKARGHL